MGCRSAGGANPSRRETDRRSQGNSDLRAVVGSRACHARMALAHLVVAKRRLALMDGVAAMNWRRGLFRLWIVGTALFVIAIASVSYSDIKAEFEAVASKAKVE